MKHDHRFRSMQGVLLVSQYATCSLCFAAGRVFLFALNFGLIQAV